MSPNGSNSQYAYMLRVASVRDHLPRAMTEAERALFEI
jgi:hypothetical protein